MLKVDCAGVLVGNLLIRLTDLQLLRIQVRLQKVWRMRGHGQLHHHRERAREARVLREHRCKLASLQHWYHKPAKFYDRSGGTMNPIWRWLNVNCVDMQVERMWPFLLALAG